MNRLAEAGGEQGGIPHPPPHQVGKIRCVSKCQGIRAKEEVTVVKLLQSSPTLCDPMNCCPPGSFCPWDFPGKNTEVGCHLFLQRIFSTQGLNWPFLHWQADSLPWNHLGSPQGRKPWSKDGLPRSAPWSALCRQPPCWSLGGRGGDGGGDGAGGGLLPMWNDFTKMAGSCHLHTGEPHATVSLTPDGGLRAWNLE